MSETLTELGRLHFQCPREADGDDVAVADWYEHKAAVLEHLADDAHRHAAALREEAA